MTSEERASELLASLAPLTDREERCYLVLGYLDDEAQAAVEWDREECARLVEGGGNDGVCRLETAIALGTNAVIAAAIRARGGRG